MKTSNFSKTNDLLLPRIERWLFYITNNLILVLIFKNFKEKEKE